MDWLQKFQRFMYGRHGPDQLTFGLFILFFVLTLFSGFLRGFAYLLLSLLSTAVLILALWRIFSRQNQKRFAENQKYLTLMQPVFRFFGKVRARWSDRKVYRYYHCPKCRATLRVPRGRGKICIQCPVCKTEFIKKA